MRAGDEQVLDRILVFRRGSLESFAAATLSAIGAGRRALDVSTVADRHHHRLFGDQILQIDIADLFAADLGAAVLTVLASDLAQVLPDDGQNVLLVRQECASGP